MSPRNILRIATYNIHRCIGGDGRYEPDRILKVIKEIDADVIGIQEIDSHCIHEEGHQLNYIVKNTQLHFVAGPTMFRADAHYGNALFSKHKIAKVKHIDLSVPGYEPRGAICAEIEIHGTPFQFVITHLGLNYRERLFQIRHLAQCLKLKTSHEAPSNLVLLGDFNEWIPFFGATRFLKKRIKRLKSHGTFPASRPFLNLDSIYISDFLKTTSCRVHRSFLAQVASDHLPVIAEIDVSSYARRETAHISLPLEEEPPLQ